MSATRYRVAGRQFWAATAVIAAAPLMAACGPDVVGAAAGGAAVSAAQLRQAQEDKARAQEQIKAMEKAQQEHQQEIDRQADGVSK